MMNTQRKLLSIAIVVVVVGLFVQALDSDMNDFVEEVKSSEGGLDGPTRDTITRERQPEPAIRSRPVSSAAQSDFEGGEPDDWDTLTSEQRIARTEDALDVLRARIADAINIEAKQRLEEEALEVLSRARADYFVDFEHISRYHELEASLGG